VNYCALTFDDGPSELTHLVLDRLEKYAIPATFFVVGSFITIKTKPVMERIFSLSCEFGNHSWSFESLDTMSKDRILHAIQKTDDAIAQITGTVPVFFRPPNLAVSQTLFDTVDKPFAQGIIANDWAACNTNAQQRSQLVLSQVQDGSIILLHDTQPLPHPTPEALDTIIPELIKRNYAFLTLSDLFKVKKIDPFSLKNAMWNTV